MDDVLSDDVEKILYDRIETRTTLDMRKRVDNVARRMLIRIEHHNAVSSFFYHLYEWRRDA